MTTTRRTTPDTLAALATAQPAPGYDLAAAIIAGPEYSQPVAPALRYDYASLGEAGEEIRRHVLSFKAAEKRMGEATIQAGLDLIAIRETIPHGHWEPLLRDEFGMGERAAQVLMQTARRFGGKAQTYALLSPSVLGLLASPSVPDEAIEAAIEAAAVSPVTVTAAKAIIAAHRPARCRICHRVLTDPAAAAQGIGACCAARMARGADVAEARATAAQTLADVVEVYGEPSAIENPTPEPSPAPPQSENGAQEENHTDPRAGVLARLALRLEGLREEMRQIGDEYGQVTGDFTTPLEIRHKLEKMQVQVKVNQGGWDDGA